MNNQPPPTDDDLRALLGADSAQPPAELDASILTAARAALPLSATRPGEPHVGRRPWYLPAGLSAAAAMLLAVLVVERAPQEAVGPVPNAPAAPLAAPNVAADLAPGEDLAHRRAARAMLEEQLQERPTDFAARGEAAQATAPAPAPQVLVGAGVAAHACVAPATALVGEGLLLCVTAAHVEVHDGASDGCQHPLVLARSPGPVSLARDGRDMIIRVDGVEQWRVHCAGATWEVRAAQP